MSANSSSASASGLQDALLRALSQLTKLKDTLEAPPAPPSAAALAGGAGAGAVTEQQAAVNAALNTAVVRLREVEEAAAGCGGAVDDDLVEFLSSAATSHPDALLQQRLQEALDARLAADIRATALRAFAAALEVAPR